MKIKYNKETKSFSITKLYSDFDQLHDIIRDQLPRLKVTKITETPRYYVLEVRSKEGFVKKLIIPTNNGKSVIENFNSEGSKYGISLSYGNRDKYRNRVRNKDSYQEVEDESVASEGDLNTGNYINVSNTTDVTSLFNKISSKFNIDEAAEVLTGDSYHKENPSKASDENYEFWSRMRGLGIPVQSTSIYEEDLKKIRANVDTILNDPFVNSNYFITLMLGKEGFPGLELITLAAKFKLEQGYDEKALAILFLFSKAYESGFTDYSYKQQQVDENVLYHLVFYGGDLIPSYVAMFGKKGASKFMKDALNNIDTNEGYYDSFEGCVITDDGVITDKGTRWEGNRPFKTISNSLSKYGIDNSVMDAYKSAINKVVNGINQ